jgi:uncharacterized Ntn-hydrolase superfamily protein
MPRVAPTQRVSAPRRRDRWPLLVALATAAVTRTAPAWATYSVVGVDPITGEVGAAGASCVPYEVIRIYASVPARGALVAQANFDDLALSAAQSALLQGKSAAEVLALVTDAAAFPAAPLMQYGVVDVHGGAASYTGPSATPVAGDRGGASEELRFIVQGNNLTSTAVLTQAEAAFRGCDLAERLVASLEAASLGGEGDARCTPDGIPAKSAFVDVTGLQGTVFRVSVPDVSPESPIPLLRDALATFRAEHPCPVTISTAIAPSEVTPRAPAACAAAPPAEAPSGPGATGALASLLVAAWGLRRARPPRLARLGPPKSAFSGEPGTGETLS